MWRRLQLIVLPRAGGCELGESGLQQDDDDGVVPGLCGVEGSFAIDRPSRSKSKAGIRSRCEKSTNDIDAAVSGCQHKQCQAASIGMVDVSTCLDEGFDHG